jgi:hypothetical protein
LGDEFMEPKGQKKFGKYGYKWFGRKRPWRSQGTMLAFACRDWGKLRETLVKSMSQSRFEASMPLHKILERYRCAKPFGSRIKKYICSMFFSIFYATLSSAFVNKKIKAVNYRFYIA